MKSATREHLVNASKRLKETLDEWETLTPTHRFVRGHVVISDTLLDIEIALNAE